MSSPIANGQLHMTEKKPRLRKGQGRRQILACQGRIQELIAHGYDVKMVYEVLCNEGLITMSYGGFYDFVTQRKRVKRRKIQLLIPGTELTPLLPAAPIIEPVLPSGQPVGAPLGSTPKETSPEPPRTAENPPPVSNVTPKIPPLSPIQQGGQSSAATATEQHRKAMELQAKLDSRIKEKERLMSDANVDPEAKEEADRLANGTPPQTKEKNKE